MSGGNIGQNAQIVKNKQNYGLIISYHTDSIP